MNVVPKNVTDKLTFFQTHLEPWSDHAAEIGTTAERVAMLAEMTAEAKEALDAQFQAYETARSATARLNSKMEQMAAMGSSIIQSIKAYAATQEDEGNAVYVLALISPPKKKSPRPAPGQPTGFTAQLLGDGSLRLKWKCANPRGTKGTTYRISRQDAPNKPFEFVDVVGVKRFVDITVPRGASEIAYQIQAMRSTTTGAVAIFPVSIGGGMKPVFHIAA